MDINFPLVLVVAVFTCALVWLFDCLFLVSKRRAAIAQVESQFGNLKLEQGMEDKAYQLARSNAEREPVVVGRVEERELKVRAGEVTKDRGDSERLELCGDQR